MELTLTAGLSVFLVMAMFSLGVTTLVQANKQVPKDNVNMSFGALYLILALYIANMTRKAIM
jgi:hypothetical protein